MIEKSTFHNGINKNNFPNKLNLNNFHSEINSKFHINSSSSTITNNIKKKLKILTQNF